MGGNWQWRYICNVFHITSNLQGNCLILKIVSGKNQSASPLCVMQHFSWFELRVDKTLPETIVFKVSELPYFKVTDNMKILHFKYIIDSVSCTFVYFSCEGLGANKLCYILNDNLKNRCYHFSFIQTTDVLSVMVVKLIWFWK